jgi:hypothetical protein
MTSYYTFNDPSNSAIQINLDDCYNAYTAGSKANNTGFQNNNIDISHRYNKLGQTSHLKYGKTNNYATSTSTLLNNLFELKLITGGNYTATPITDGVLLKIIASTTLTFNNLTLTNPSFVLVAGGGGGGCANQSNAGGGGGGGEVLEIAIPTNVINYIDKIDITIGDGGNGGVSDSNGQSGGNSIITLYRSSYTKTYGANGGGGGGAGKMSGLSGGSGGGGGSYSNANTLGGASVKYANNPSGTGKGFGGGSGTDNNNDNGNAGGGGGATADGGAINGGNGFLTTILGINSNTDASNNIYVGDGGGGGGETNGIGGIGGSNTNGGKGGGSNILPTAGKSNTGTGGGGAQNAGSNDYQVGANGGSGVFYLVIKNNNLSFNANIVSTITGSGTNTISITDNTYTYTFTGGTNEIQFNQNIPSLNVIVCGGGGNGGYSSTNGGGGGGGGGGYGVWNFSYTNGTIYTSSVGGSGSNSIFKKNTTQLGVTATGGAEGSVSTNRMNDAIGGTCSIDEFAEGTLTARNGGNGGGVAKSGTNSDGIITVLGINYNYGGGGASGTDTTATTSGGGNPGVNGVGATTRSPSTSQGQSATTVGSGGGGANRNGSNPATLRTGGIGADGIIIITFVI